MIRVEETGSGGHLHKQFSNVNTTFYRLMSVRLIFQKHNQSLLVREAEIVCTAYLLIDSQQHPLHIRQNNPDIPGGRTGVASRRTPFLPRKTSSNNPTLTTNIKNSFSRLNTLGRKRSESIYSKVRAISKQPQLLAQTGNGSRGECNTSLTNDLFTLTSAWAQDGVAAEVGDFDHHTVVNHTVCGLEASMCLNITGVKIGHALKEFKTVFTFITKERLHHLLIKKRFVLSKPLQCHS